MNFLRREINDQFIPSQHWNHAKKTKNYRLKNSEVRKRTLRTRMAGGATKFFEVERITVRNHLRARTVFVITGWWRKRWLDNWTTEPKNLNLGIQFEKYHYHYFSENFKFYLWELHRWIEGGFLLLHLRYLQVTSLLCNPFPHDFEHWTIFIWINRFRTEKIRCTTFFKTRLKFKRHTVVQRTFFQSCIG